MLTRFRGGTLPPVLILAVCAVSARFSTHPKVNSHPAFLRGDSWAAEARKIVLNRYEWPNITILTCLLLLGLHEFGTCYGGRSWALGGMAIRMAYALQLHRDLDHDPCRPNSRIQLSFVDREIRRRTMWACFLMDRFNSSGTDRPMFIKEETIQVQLPIKEKLFQLDMEGPTENLTGDVPYPAPSTDGELSDARENMGVAAYIIRSIALWGRIIIYHFQGGRDRDAHAIWEAESEFAALKKQTEEFVDSLPDELKFTQANINAHETDGLANQFMFLHITSMQNVIILHHNASTPFPSRPGRLPRPTPPAPFVADCAKTAFEAAKKMSEYLRAAEGFAVTAPFAGYCAFLSSSIQMAAAFSKDTAIAAEAKRNLATNVRYLTKVKRYWGAFHWTSEQLKNQFKACADAANRGMAAGGAGMQIMYGDWFDRYPHGVSQSDFEDPAVRVKTEKGDDAVLEHKSDLQSVEQFFRSIPPTQPGDQKGKKRKTQAAAAKAGAVGAGTLQSPSPLNQNALTTPSPTVLQNQGHPQHPTTQQQQHHLNPTAQPFTTVSHLPPYIPTTTQPFPSHLPPNQTSFFGADPSAIPAHIPFPYQLSSGILPQLDRQLVYGAYAGLEMPGLDPNAMSWNSPNNGLPGLGIGEMEWAAQMDGDGHVGGEGMNEGATGGGGLESSAWFMPFNMQPPTGMMDGSEGDAFGLGGEAYGMGMGGGMAMELGPSQQGQGGQQQGGQQGNMGQ